MKLCVYKFILALIFFIFNSILYSATIDWGTELSSFTYSKMENIDIRSKNKDQSLQISRHNYKLNDTEELNSLRLTFDYEQKNLSHLVSGILKDNYISKLLPGAFNKVASFENPEHQITIKIPQYLFLNQKEQIHSFSIMFMIQTYIITEDSKVFEKIIYLKGKKYGISCFLKNNKITFEFYNLFWDKDVSIPVVSIQAKQTIHRLQFDKVALLYDATDGLLKLYFNLEEQQVLYLTNTGTEEGYPLLMKNHPLDASLLVIGKHFRGALDEFIFSNAILSLSPESFTYGNLKNNYGFFAQRQASFISKRYSLTYSQSLLSHFFIEASEPYGTKIELYIRYSDSPFTENINEFEMPFTAVTFQNRQDSMQGFSWIESVNMKIKAKYYQWKLILYPDPLGRATPIISKIKLDYYDNTPPSVPLNFTLLESKDDSLTFIWSRNPEHDVINGGRYHIYYGITPDKALGIIRYKSIHDTDKKVINDMDRIQSKDIHLHNKLKVVINNDVILQNLIYTKDKPSLMYQYPSIQKNIPMYWWVTACDNAYNESPENMDHESGPSKSIIVRP